MRYDALEAEYAGLWRAMHVRPDWSPLLDKTARRIIAGRHRYAAIQTAVGVPWYVVGIIHQLEAGGLWDRHLHNGDKLTTRTRQEPKGYPKAAPADGSCYSWDESAIDALRLKRLHEIAEWSVPRIAYELERYNGFGYRTYHPHVLTPYLWSGTGHYTSGKYIADKQWSDAAVSEQCGGMALLSVLMRMDPSIAPPGASDEPDPAQAFTRTPEAPRVEHMGQSSTGNTALVIGGGGTGNVALELSTASARLASSGKPPSIEAFVLLLASSPTFWISLITILGAAYVWFERRRKLQAEGK